jgi:hypothetical protein
MYHPMYKKGYLHQDVTSTSATLKDFPGVPVIDFTSDVYKTVKSKNDAGKDVTTYSVTASAIDKMLEHENYKLQVNLKFKTDYKLQTYLVNADTLNPVGYISWGLTITRERSGPVIVETPAKWNAKIDEKVWKDL